MLGNAPWKSAERRRQSGLELDPKLDPNWKGQSNTERYGAGFATLKIPKNSEGKALAQTQRDNAVRLLEPVPPRQCGLGPSSAHNH